MDKLSTSATLNVSFRYSDERYYRLYACGITSVDLLRSIVSHVAGLCGVEDIRIALDLCETDFKQFTP